jgi:SAM-dependent methyltransferase
VTATARYDRIGVGYSVHRRPDPRIEVQVRAAVGDGRVLNVGAGTGSYEPDDLPVVAVEPSDVMLEQRRPGAAPAVKAVAGALPFADRSFDVALAVITVHHWPDPAAGLLDMSRVAPRRVVLSFEPEVHSSFWLLHEYLPVAYSLARQGPSLDEVAAAVSTDGAAVRIETVPIPADCVDGFNWAYWRRPERYLDPSVRAAISGLARLAPSELEPGLARLDEDLRSGRWAETHADLLERDEVDGGFRLVIAG